MNKAQQEVESQEEERREKATMKELQYIIAPVILQLEW